MTQNKSPHSPQIVQITDLPAQIWYMQTPIQYGSVNPAHCQFVGATAEALKKESLSAIENIEIKSRLKSMYTRCFENPRAQTRELRFPDLKIVLNVSSVPVQSEASKEVILFIAQPSTYSETPSSSRPIPVELMEKSLAGTGAGLWNWNIQTGETIFDDNWAGMLGYTLAELTPLDIHTWEKLTHPDDLETSGKLLAAHLEKKIEKYDAKVRMKHKDGHWVWIHDRGSVYEFDEEGAPLLMAGTHVDISVRQSLSEALERQSSFQWLASKFSAALIMARPDNLDEIIEAGLGEIGIFLGSDRVYIFKLNLETETMNNIHEWVAPGVIPEKENLKEVPFEAFPWWMDKIHNGETIYIPDVSKIEAEQRDLQEILEMQYIKSLIVVPIMGPNEIIGFWGLDFVQDFWIFDEFSHQVLRFVSSIISGALEANSSQKRILHLLDESKTNFRKVANQTRSIIVTTNLAHKINYVNTAFKDIFGFTDKDILFKKPHQVLSANISGQVKQLSVAELLQDGGQWEGSFLNRTRDNHLIIENAKISPLFSGDGSRTGYIKVAENITAAKKHSEWLDLLRLAHEFSLGVHTAKTDFMTGLKILLENLAQFTFAQSVIFLPLENSSRPFLNSTSTSTNDPLANHLPPSIKALDLARFTRLDGIHQVGEDSLAPWANYLQSATGEIFFSPVASELKTYGLMLCSHQSNIKYYDAIDQTYFTSFTNILGHVLYELELTHFMHTQNQSEQITRIAAGLAHEVRNPLAVISMSMEVLDRDLDGQKESVQKAFKLIDKSLTRASSIVESLMILGNPESDTSNLSSLDLSQILNEATLLVTFHLRKNRIIVDYQKNVEGLTVRGTQEGLLKVFVNILLNAIQAIDSDGTITISATRIIDEDIVISFSDTGPGIPKLDISRVLKPYFSTKKDKPGSGMGLYICNEIIQGFGGKLEIANNQDRGAIVKIQLLKGKA